jgi:predicted DNA-binding transcriptional regulator YafY
MIKLIMSNIQNVDLSDGVYRMQNMNSTSQNPASTEALSYAQRERLIFIEFRLYFLGDVRRQDLMQRFGVAPAVATRDFALYRDLFPDNISFDNKSKCYVIGDDFSPEFNYSPERVLTALSRGFSEGIGGSSEPLLSCELPKMLNQPSMAILAPITRAIHQQKVVSIEYTSHNSGYSNREIAPFALVNDGLRWHVRAFDRKRQAFLDFVITRILKSQLIKDSPVLPQEQPSADIQWNRIVELDLVPHPSQEHPEIIENDYGMTDGVLHLKLRAAVAGYALRQWIVDCSSGHSLQGKEYRLWLRNHLALYGVSSAMFAPGYEFPEV